MPIRQTVKQDIFNDVRVDRVNALGNLMDGLVQKNRAMMRAADHADRADDSWGSKALGFVVEVCARGQMFTSEDVRELAYKQGLTRPPDERAWGAVLYEARTLGYVRSAGFVNSRLPHAHQRPIRRWEPI